MAFRPDLKIKKNTSHTFPIIKIALMILTFFVILIVGFILYFNGQHVKAPLIKLLEERTSLNVNCKQVEFSPIYPNILKIQELSLGHSLIGEIYLEYDIKSVINEQAFKINYLYIKNAKLNAKDLSVLKKERFGYEKIDIAKLDLVDVPLYFERFLGKDVDLHAQNIHMTPKEITFTEATLTATEATFDDIKLNNLSLKVSQKDSSYEVTDFNAKMFGGNVSAEFTTEGSLKTPHFRNMVFNNAIFQDLKRYLSEYSFTADSVLLNNCVLSIPAKDLLIGQLNGSATNISLNEGQLNYSFEGKAGEISKPTLGISADRSFIKASSHNHGLDLELNGKVLTGEYALKLSLNSDVEAIKSYFDDLDDLDDPLIKDTDSLIVIHEASLKKAKLEPDIQLMDRMRELFYGSSYLIKSFDLVDTEVVSNIDEIPFQSKTFNIHIKDLLRLKHDETATFNLDTLELCIKNGYFRDLYLDDLTAKISSTNGNTSISLDEITFMKSTLTATVNVDKSNHINFKLKGEDFDTGELNSSFFDRTLSGKINIDTKLTADLSQMFKKETKADDDKTNPLLNGIEGYINLSAKNLMISGLGLDLLNGGSKKSHYLTYDKFFDLLKHDDLGLYNLDSVVNIDRDHLTFSIKSDLATSHINLKGNCDIHNDLLLAKGSISSLSKGNITLLKIEGPLTEPNFIIFPILRTESRPGLDDYLKDSPGETSYKEPASNAVLKETDNDSKQQEVALEQTEE